jgi:hypothetical protein
LAELVECHPENEISRILGDEEFAEYFTVNTQLVRDREGQPGNHDGLPVLLEPAERNGYKDPSVKISS